MSWAVIAVMAAGAYAWKAVGWFGLSRVRPRGRWVAVAALLPAAMMAALVANQTFGSGGARVMVTRAAGVAVGGLAAWRRAPLMVVLVVAGGVAAGLRWIWG